MLVFEAASFTQQADTHTHTQKAKPLLHAPPPKELSPFEPQAMQCAPLSNMQPSARTSGSDSIEASSTHNKHTHTKPGDLGTVHFGI